MREFKKLLKFMEGYRLIYLFGIISIIISQILTTVTPLILSTTFDNIIREESIKSSIIQRTVNIFGGRDILREKLWIIGILLLSVTIVRGIFLYLKNTLSSKAAEGTTKKMRDKLYDHIQRLPYDYHVKSETGELIQKCTSDVDTIKRFIAIQLMEIVGSVFMIALVISIMFSMNIKLTFASVLILPITFSFALIFFKKVKKDFTASDEAEARMTTTLQENLTGVRVVKAFSRQKFEVDKFDERNFDYQKLTYKLIKNLSIYWGISDFLSMTQVGFVAVVGSYLSYKGELSLGVFVAFVSYINMLVWPVRQMGRTLTDMGKAFVSLNRVEEILETPIELLEENNSRPDIKGNIEFENVCFQYEEDKPVLSDLSFSVNTGQTIALIGPTGSGKSSLVHLLPRLYEYNKGSIKFDGVELNTIDKSWIRKNVGLVLQEPFLYAKTIKDNIKLAYPGMTDEKVYEAAKIASIHEDINSFELGYETLVGERGVSLSGGQKQRMAIARTIINNSPIVVFDDSLSAVDTETDISIRKALNTRKNKATTIIISHRISTVSEADMILVIDRGKIIQRGTHDSLINEEGLYKRVYTIQNSLDDEAIDA
ncbi:ABC transporter ATP-binding protein [Tissierella sp.]|uniref:ABC transporter ATP-binding protein n=1 Tax=Tissierella sp. TaxID=41274 RepID=UPI002863B048|nr:ABC transporter ATP-binding protein [Tissierella sp.]MDR7857675.1 ABC transporter ATP-binding protein [Tissierella sp.]